MALLQPIHLSLLAKVNKGNQDHDQMIHEIELRHSLEIIHVVNKVTFLIEYQPVPGPKGFLARPSTLWIETEELPKKVSHLRRLDQVQLRVDVILVEFL